MSQPPRSLPPRSASSSSHPNADAVSSVSRSKTYTNPMVLALDAPFGAPRPLPKLPPVLAHHQKALHQTQLLLKSSQSASHFKSRSVSLPTRPGVNRVNGSNPYTVATETILLDMGLPAFFAPDVTSSVQLSKTKTMTTFTPPTIDHVQESGREIVLENPMDRYSNKLALHGARKIVPSSSASVPVPNTIPMPGSTSVSFSGTNSHHGLVKGSDGKGEGGVTGYTNFTTRNVPYMLDIWQRFEEGQRHVDVSQVKPRRISCAPMKQNDTLRSGLNASSVSVLSQVSESNNELREVKGIPCKTESLVKLQEDAEGALKRCKIPRLNVLETMKELKIGDENYLSQRTMRILKKMSKDAVKSKNAHDVDRHLTAVISGVDKTVFDIENERLTDEKQGDEAERKRRARRVKHGIQHLLEKKTLRKLLQNQRDNDEDDDSDNEYRSYVQVSAASNTASNKNDAESSLSHLQRQKEPVSKTSERRVLTPYTFFVMRLQTAYGLFTTKNRIDKLDESTRQHLSDIKHFLDSDDILLSNPPELSDNDIFQKALYACLKLNINDDQVPISAATLLWERSDTEGMRYSIPLYESLLSKPSKSPFSVQEKKIATIALLSLGEVSEHILSTFIHLYADSDDSQRPSFANELSDFKNSPKENLILTVLRPFLSHPDWRIRRFVVECLSSLLHLDESQPTPSEEDDTTTTPDPLTPIEVFSIDPDNPSPTRPISLHETILNDIMGMLHDDWNDDVRVACSTLIASFRQHQFILSYLLRNLTHHDPTKRADTLRTFAWVGVMTASGMKMFLKCFWDDHASVRREACKVACSLASDHDELVEALMDRFDDADWRVRAFSIKALAKSKNTDKKVREMLQWYLLHDKHPNVKAEACVAIRELNLVDETIQSILIELVMDSNEQVRAQAQQTLATVGLQHTKSPKLVDEETMSSVVKQLCNKSSVIQELVIIPDDN